MDVLSKSNEHLIYIISIIHNNFFTIWYSHDRSESIKLIRRRYQRRALLRLSQVASFGVAAAVTTKNEDGARVRVRN